jgi:N-acetylmuramoyl-L-alanine amidase
MSLEQAMKLIDDRPGWEVLPALNVSRYPGEIFLKGMTICIDPGHGGTDGGETTTRPAGYKSGPTGLKEAFINLRVGLLLERLLTDAGVNVIMTRHADSTISLHDRAEVANNAKRLDGGIGADLFVSIHHNASRPSSNYPSVWYHGSIDDNEPDVDVARHIAFELGQQMHTQVAKTSPIFSSQLMYGSGFGVLRQAKMPAVLCECSFMTNPAEEQRLRGADYSLREAYAIYLGLCKWAYCGRPTQTAPITSSSNGEKLLTTTLAEGLPPWWGSDRNRIFASSVEVTLDGKRLPIEFDELSRRLTATLPPNLDSGQEHVVVVHHENMLGNHNWPQRYRLGAVGKPATALPALRPEHQPPLRKAPAAPATSG